MARKTKSIIIRADNRDQGKKFVIQEMTAFDAEMWASDALFGLAQSGVDFPDDIKEMGMQAVVMFGFKALGRMQQSTYRDLMARLMDCVIYVPDPKNETMSRHPDKFVDLGGDIEEVSTRLMLKAEVFSLMTGFTLPDVLSLGSPSTTGQN